MRYRLFAVCALLGALTNLLLATMIASVSAAIALRFLTGGGLDTRSGQFLSLSGRPKFYRATDNLWSKCYQGILPDDLFDIVSMNGLHFSHGTESGVLFHMIGAVSE